VHESCEGRIDLPASAGIEELDLQPDGAGSRLHVFQRGLDSGTGRINEHGKTSGSGYNFTQQFQPCLGSRLHVIEPAMVSLRVRQPFCNRVPVALPNRGLLRGHKRYCPLGGATKPCFFAPAPESEIDYRSRGPHAAEMVCDYLCVIVASLRCTPAAQDRPPLTLSSSRSVSSMSFFLLVLSRVSAGFGFCLTVFLRIDSLHYHFGSFIAVSSKQPMYAVEWLGAGASGHLPLCSGSMPQSPGQTSAAILGWRLPGGS
jgi:hypothetical protein